MSHLARPARRRIPKKWPSAARKRGRQATAGHAYAASAAEVHDSHRKDRRAVQRQSRATRTASICSIALLDEQAYRLSYWRVAADEINYRRFFDINELAALSMEKLEVFTAAHELVLRLLSQGKIDGLRIDHPDGLYDPEAISAAGCSSIMFSPAPAKSSIGARSISDQEWKELEGPLLEATSPTRRLRPATRPALCRRGENPRAPRGLAGRLADARHQRLRLSERRSTACSSIRRGEEPLTPLYRQWTGDDTPFAEIAYQKKYLILRDALSSELHMLGRQTRSPGAEEPLVARLHAEQLAFRLAARSIACFPVYRSYISDEGVHESDRKYVETGRAPGHPPQSDREPVAVPLRPRHAAAALSGTRPPKRTGPSSAASPASSSRSRRRSWPRAWRTRPFTSTIGCCRSTRSAAIRRGSARPASRSIATTRPGKAHGR